MDFTRIFNKVLVKSTVDILANGYTNYRNPHLMLNKSLI